MTQTPISLIRNRAYELADTGKFHFWTEVRSTLLKEGRDAFLVRLLDGDGYFKFRIRQRMNTAKNKL